MSRVLLVEDEPALSGMLSRFLSRAGYEVVACGSAAEARAKWGAGFAAAVVDLGLPDAPGEALVNEMVRAVEGVPLVVSSGSPASALQWDQGAERIQVLQKPYLPAELLRVLSVALAAEAGALGQTH